jgi:hypothetical protein
MATQVDLGKIRPVWKGDWAASTAYEQNDMVKEGVDSYICTAAHTSGSTFSDTNWDILALGAEMPDQTGNAGEFLTTNGTSMTWAALPPSDDASALTQGTLSTDRMAAGTIIKRTVVTNFSRQSLSTGSSRVIYNFSFTKEKPHADSYLVVQGRWTQKGTYSDFCGLYCVIAADDNSGTNDSSAFYGIGYSDNGEQNVGSISKSFDSSAIGTGSNTLRIGWRARNGDSGNSPGQVWNPNSSDDAREHQNGTYIIIDEVAK